MTKQTHLFEIPKREAGRRKITMCYKVGVVMKVDRNQVKKKMKPSKLKLKLKIKSTMSNCEAKVSEFSVIVEHLDCKDQEKLKRSKPIRKKDFGE